MSRGSADMEKTARHYGTGRADDDLWYRSSASGQSRRRTIGCGLPWIWYQVSYWYCVQAVEEQWCGVASDQRHGICRSAHTARRLPVRGNTGLRTYESTPPTGCTSGHTGTHTTSTGMRRGSSLDQLSAWDGPIVPFSSRLQVDVLQRIRRGIFTAGGEAVIQDQFHARASVDPSPSGL